VFENRVLRKIFRPKRDEVPVGWRKLHNEELRDLYPSPSIIRKMRKRRMKWAGHVARIGEKRNAYGLLVGKPEGRGLLGRLRHSWTDNINMDLEMLGNYRVATQLVASRIVLSSTELVVKILKSSIVLSFI
jgi:hypothetical protein